MPVLSWSTRYETGNILVDEQHQELFALVNGLYLATKAGKANARLGRDLRKLVNYVKKHFRTEENLMAMKEYPYLAEHKASHAALTKKTLEMTGQFNNGQMQGALPLSLFLAQWIVDHILDEDMRMFKWIRQGKQDSLAETMLID